MLLFTFCFIPQIIAILKTKNVSGLSLSLWVMVVSGHAAGLVYAVWLKVPILIATYLIGFTLALWTLGLVIYCRAKGP